MPVLEGSASSGPYTTSNFCLRFFLFVIVIVQVGNPSTDNYYDGVGGLDYLLSHAIISPKTHDDLIKACNYSDPNCCSQQCNDIYYYANQVEIGGIDFYSIDTPACKVSANGTPNRRRLTQAHKAFPPKRTNPVCLLYRKVVQ